MTNVGQAMDRVWASLDVVRTGSDVPKRLRKLDHQFRITTPGPVRSIA